MIYIVILISLFLLYTIFPTVLIRSFEWGIMKKLNGAGMALTFDDGPNPEYTGQLLDLLKKYNVKATFFVVGSKVKKYPDVIKRIHHEGHTIGIHHYHHVSSWVLSPFQLKKQLKLTEMVIQECTNEKVTFYRPPWGHFNLFTLLLSKKYQIVMWSAIFGDWKVQTSLLEKLRETTEPSSILLLHDCGETWGADREAPKYMLEDLEVFLRENQGTKFMTLKDL
ncbi:MAG TPA: polysaccharide deacetylase family protein [Bacillales bacterium]|nr:polysaccharide deacetylase family protein [Bacillales bacterium]